MVTLNSRIRASQDVLFRDLGGEAVILNLATGQYYGFDETATRMWSVLTASGLIRDACHQLLAEYEVEENALQADLLKFVDDLVVKQLVQVDGA